MVIQEKKATSEKARCSPGDMPPGRQEQSDEKFIAWSKSTYTDSYDVVTLCDYLAGLEQNSFSALDIGGGIGIFANTVMQQCSSKQISFTIVDPGIEASSQRIEHPAVDYVLSPYAAYSTQKRYDFIVFRLVLHHLIGSDAADTDRSQTEALAKARSLLKDDGFLFVVENYYQPMIGTDVTSKIIYRVTSSKAIASVTRRLGANTAGEGVRFRSLSNWTQIFNDAGFEFAKNERHSWWGNDMPLWQRIPLLCKHRFQAASVLTRRQPGKHKMHT